MTKKAKKIEDKFIEKLETELWCALHLKSYDEDKFFKNSHRIINEYRDLISLSMHYDIISINEYNELWDNVTPITDKIYDEFWS